MPKPFGLICALLLPLAALTACTRPVTPAAVPDANGNFHLIVSNQSFAIDPVDLQIAIDGSLVVQEDFAVGTQHTYKPFRFQLAAGLHRITVTSRKGAASLDQTFQAQGEQWAVVEYWYYPPTHYSPTPRHVSFSLGHEKLMIE